MNFFESSESNEPIIIDQGDGSYRVTISIIIEVMEKRAKIISQKNFVKKDDLSLDSIPDEFKEAILKVNPEIPEFVAKKFYESIKKSKGEGITKREIVRACGRYINSRFCEEVLSSLVKSKILSASTYQTRGKGRPKYVVILREYA